MRENKLAKRRRIDWLRMMKDQEILYAAKNGNDRCSTCKGEYEDCMDFSCIDGHLKWWHEVVSFKTFRNEVGFK